MGPIAKACDKFLDWMMDRMAVAIAFIMLVLVIGGVFVAYYSYKDVNSPTFTLKKDDWSCTESIHEIVHPAPMMVMVGKIAVPMPQTPYLVEVCTNYKKIR